MNQKNEIEKNLIMIYVNQNIFDYKLFEKIGMSELLRERIEIIESNRKKIQYKKYLTTGIIKENYPIEKLKLSPSNKELKILNILLLEFIDNLNIKNKIQMDLLVFYKISYEKIMKIKYKSIEELEELKAKVNLRKVDKIDIKAMTLLFGLGFIDEVEEFYLKTFNKIIYKNINKVLKKIKVSIDDRGNILSEYMYFEKVKDIDSMALGNIEIANIELIKLYKEQGLSIRDIELYPLLDINGDLRKFKKSYIQSLSNKEKDYNRHLVKHELEKELKYKFELINYSKGTVERILKNLKKDDLIKKQKDLEILKLKGFEVYKREISQKKILFNNEKYKEIKEILENGGKL